MKAETPRSSALQAGRAVGYLFVRHKFKKSTNTIERSINMWHLLEPEKKGMAPGKIQTRTFYMCLIKLKSQNYFHDLI